MQAQLTEHDLNNIKRIIKKNNETTTLLKADLATQKKYEETFKNYKSSLVAPNARTIIQCFKCQKII
jgi:hypothetical protein